MADGESGVGSDFYKVMGLKKECSPDELRNAYKKLAMRWHPDRCSASKNEEAKSKFQAIQEAYSVLSDTNKRLLYDIGIDEEEEEEKKEENAMPTEKDEENVVADFMGEIDAMMRKNKSTDEKVESFRDLQDLFKEMFQVDASGAFTSFFDPPQSSSSSSGFNFPQSSSSSSGCFADPFMFFNVDADADGSNLKRDRADMTSGRRPTIFPTSSVEVEPPAHFNASNQSFCFGIGDSGMPHSSNAGDSRRRSGRKQKVSSRHDVSSQDAGMSESLSPQRSTSFFHPLD